ncbi:MAG: GTPase HflX, partial [Bacteroidales bacterium]|nr:GTPase HflX [Bacteroidales bacterium]
RCLIVFNKTDQYRWVPKAEDDLTPPTKENIPLSELERTWMSKLGEGAVFVSAKTGENMDGLKERIREEVQRLYAEIYPYRYVSDPYSVPTDENS